MFLTTDDKRLNTGMDRMAFTPDAPVVALERAREDFGGAGGTPIGQHRDGQRRQPPRHVPEHLYRQDKGYHSTSVLII